MECILNDPTDDNYIYIEAMEIMDRETLEGESWISFNIKKHSTLTTRYLAANELKKETEKNIAHDQ